jgi:outer membrane protein assembly factor BamB
MLNSYKKGYLVTIIAILSTTSVMPALVYGAPLGSNENDWQLVNGNTWAWNYSPQSQINKDKVDQLEVKWLFPVGSSGLAPAGLTSISLSEGANTPPVVRDGKAVFETNWLRIYAVDAATGREIWTNDYTVDLDAARDRLPINIGGPHLHGIRYWETEDVILAGGVACDFYAVDFQTGETKWNIGDLCKDVPGSIYAYSPGGPVDENNIGTYEEGRQFIYSLRGNSGAWRSNGRNVIMGISMDTHQILWRVFNQPPQNIPVKDWALEECDIGFFQTYPCNDVAALNREGLEWDWAQPGEPVSRYGGVGANWGQPVVDEDTGLMYLNTGNQSPYTNVSATPGPRLYGSTIMAINMDTGIREWWVQPFPHDPYDYDCNWSGMLIDDPTLGKVYVKGCKEGILYIMDAATGEPIQQIDVLEEIYPGTKTYHLTDPFSFYDLREWDWPENSRYHGDAPVYLVPAWIHGVFATDLSYDNEGTIFHYANFHPGEFTSRPFVEEGGSANSASFDIEPTTTTIAARDLATGNIKWTWFYPFSSQRAHMLITGDMVVTGFTDGRIRFFDKDTGQLLREMNVGAPVVTGLTAGKDANGDSKIFVISGMTSFVGLYGYGPNAPRIPGTVISIGLSESQKTITTTSTTRTTITTTSATTSTVTSTAQASTTTVTSESTTTVTTEITEETGLPAEITYAAVAVAVIAIIAAAFLIMRKR